MDWSHFWFSFGLSVFAGLSTVIGCAFIFIKKISNKFIAVALGFSAGVMIYVSFMELMVNASKELSGIKGGNWILLAAFFGGILLIGIIDRLVPESNNPHELHANIIISSDKIDRDAIATQLPEKNRKKSIMRTGVLSMIVIAIHNFPEGLATFTAASQDVTLGIAIAVAVAIHNIPEGISIALPIYEGTGSRKKAFIFTLISGLAEPLGALIGFLILAPFLNGVFMGVLFAVISGIMVYISLDELLPSAREYGETHLSIYGLVAGMLIMGVSLNLL